MASYYSPWRRRLGLVSAYFRKNPVWCTWQVTYRCNFHCTFCHYWKEKHSPKDEQSLDDIRVASNKLAKLGSLMISIAGGEPFLRRDITQITSVLAQHHFPFITTNGWLVTRKIAREIFESGLWGVSVSIDYADPDKHDEFRGMKGSFERAVNALRYFSEERTQSYQRVNLMAVLNHENLNEMEKLIRLAAKYKAWFMVQPYCRIKTGDARFIPKKGASAKLLELKQKYPNFLSNAVFLKNFDHALNGGVPGCVAGEAFFNIDNYGGISKCVEDRSNPVANILSDTTEQILESLRKKHAVNQCQACWYNCRGEVESLYNFKGALLSLPILIGKW